MITGASIPPSRRLYGDDLAGSFGGEAPAPAIVTRSMPHAELAVTELRVDVPEGGLSDPLPCIDAYVVSHELRSFRGMDYWEGDRHRSKYDLNEGDTTITDLHSAPRVRFDVPVHCMLWLVPRAALNTLADEANVAHIDGLPHAPGKGFVDDTIRHLNLAALAALRRPEQTNRLFVDHLALAFAAHVAQRYGGMECEPQIGHGGLSRQQQRRATEMLSSDLSGATPLCAIAAACGLSSGHFARAFRQSTGLAPHAWLVKARVDRAMALLRLPEMSLSEIALACGFADQSHFSRVFRRQTGQSPRDWRRNAII